MTPIPMIVGLGNVGLKYPKMKEIIVLCHSLKTAYPDKFWFSSYKANGANVLVWVQIQKISELA